MNWYRRTLIGAILFVANMGLPSYGFSQQTPAQTTTPTQISLSQFVDTALKDMKLPVTTKIAGLSDAQSLMLQDVQQLNQRTITAKVSIKNIPFDVIKYTPAGKTRPVFIFGAKNLDLAKTIPGIAGTPLGALGGFGSAVFVYASRENAGQLFRPSFDSSGQPTVPKIIRDTLGQNNQGVAIKAGMNLLAAVSTENPSSRNPCASESRSNSLSSTISTSMEFT